MDLALPILAKFALRVRAYHLGFCTLGASFDRAELTQSNSRWPDAPDVFVDNFMLSLGVSWQEAQNLSSIRRLKELISG